MFFCGYMYQAYLKAQNMYVFTYFSIYSLLFPQLYCSGKVSIDHIVCISWLQTQLHVHTARLRIDEVHLLPAITENTLLEYLIPTTTGAGACTTALVDFLVLVHNNFIEGCRGIVTEQETRCFLYTKYD